MQSKALDFVHNPWSFLRGFEGKSKVFLQPFSILQRTLKKFRVFDLQKVSSRFCTQFLIDIA